MKIEVLIIKDDEAVIHKSVTTVDEGSNPFNVAIQAMINQLTGYNLKPVTTAILKSGSTTPEVQVDSVKELAATRAAIAKDFGVSTAKAVPTFNIKTIPTIKMNEVLKGS